MNERIRELYEQAHVVYEIPYESSVVDSTIVSIHKHKQFNPEKFAELIVRECEKVAKDGPWYYDAPSCGWRNPINFVCKEMKEHFGVEE